MRGTGSVSLHRPASGFPMLASALLAVLFVGGCAEVPRCIERGAAMQLVVQCNAGKVPVCGDDPALIYDDDGALLRVPPASVTNGSCDGIDGECRPRPVCGAAGETPTCATGEAPQCVLGRIETLEIRSDSGPGPDAGPEPDAGDDADAGADSDAGGTDAGASTDAGPDTDAGP